MNFKFKKAFRWFLDTVEGNDGKASARRLTALWFVILISFWIKVASAHITKLNVYSVYILLILTVATLLLFGIMTAQHLVEVFKGKFTNNADA